jgi:hypothetical protein
LIFLASRLEDCCIMSLRNVDKHLPDYKASHPRR